MLYFRHVAGSLNPPSRFNEHPFIIDIFFRYFLSFSFFVSLFFFHLSFVIFAAFRQRLFIFFFFFFFFFSFASHASERLYFRSMPRLLPLFRHSYQITPALPHFTSIPTPRFRRFRLSTLMPMTPPCLRHYHRFDIFFRFSTPDYFFSLRFHFEADFRHYR
jgi:hypothetical protein